MKFQVGDFLPCRLIKKITYRSYMYLERMWSMQEKKKMTCDEKREAWWRPLVEMTLVVCIV